MDGRFARALALGCGIAAIVAIGAWYIYTHYAQLVVLDPAGPVALAERNVIFITLLLCAVVVVPVFGMLAAFAWRYHTNNPLSKDEHLPDWDHTRVAEIVCWLIPSVIIVALGVLAWNSSHSLDPYRPLASNTGALEVEVVSLDWKWLFIYPAQDIATVNFLEIPENTPVHFDITSDAPMNSFWIPALGGQIMSMPGMSNQLNLAASHTGDFRGLSGNISGQGFAGMFFTTRAVSPSDFDAWVAQVRASSTPLSTAAYQALSAPSTYTTVTTYAPVADNLYDSIIASYMAPGTSTEMSATSMPMNMSGMTMSP